MKKNLLAALLVLCSLIIAQTSTSRKATITSTDGSVQEMLIIDENMDSIQVKMLDGKLTLPKNKIKSIVYSDSNQLLGKMDQKLDTVITLQKNTYAVLKNNPLEKKNFGFEVNLPRLVSNNDKSFTASGTVSFFNIDRNAEIAFPFYYSKAKDDFTNLETYTLDCHYRYFLNFFDNVQNGFYISAAARYAHLYGTLGEYEGYFGGHNSNVYKKGSEDKLGLGFGFGYRIFSKKGLYWGFSFTAGRYLVGENDRFQNDILSLDDDRELILDFELLKFGWAF